MQITVLWSDLKAFANARSLSIQWVIVNGCYNLAAIDGSMELNAQIKIESPANADQVEFETSYKNAGNRTLGQSSAFASKQLGSKKLYRRKHGFSGNCPPGVLTDIPFTVPYALCKINKVEVIGCESGDLVNLKVYDSVTGMVQQSMGIPAGSVNPSFLLNQFGFNVVMPHGSYTDHSEYDAELYGGMIIEVEYFNNGVSAKVIGVNVTLHEVK